MNPEKTTTAAAFDADPFAVADGDIAYIRPVEVDGQPAYAIHTADGTMLGVVDDWHTAFATARVYDFEPVAVH